MKKISAALLAFSLVAVVIAHAQLDRSIIPGPGPAPAVAFPDYDLLTTPNGIRVIIVKNSELPTISIRLLIDRKPVLEKDDAGCLDIAGQLLRTGTTTRTKDQLDDAIDLIGGDLGSGGTSVYASGLSKYTETLFELMSDITLHPSFPQDQLDKIITQTKSELQYRKADPNMIVDVVRKKILYGADHPYGEVETEETVGKITRDKCIAAYNAYFRPNAAIIAVVGDANKDSIMAMVNKYFGGWQTGSIPSSTFPTPPSLDSTRVAFVDRPSSVQSVLRVTETVELPRTSPDVMPVQVMNTILGGGAFRLFVNLREKHAYTYGAYSSIGPDELIGSFTASASTKNMVTDSALTQIFYELNRIRNEKVDSAELQMAKNYLSGSFVRSLEEANTVAEDAINIERYHLPKDYFKTYLKRLDAVTADDVQRVAKQYIQPDRMLVAVIGSAKDVESTLTQFGPLDVYDEDGNKVVEKAEPPITITADEIFAKFLEKTGGIKKIKAMKDKTIEMSGKVRNVEMKITIVQKAPNKFYAKTEMIGMFKQEQGFDGKKGWTVSPQGMSDITGEQLDELKFQSAFDFYGQYKKLGLTAKVTGIKTIKGKECYEVSFSGPAGKSMKQYFGVDDFLKFRDVKTMNTPNGPVDQTSDYFDYKNWGGGFLAPTRVEQGVMGQSFDFTIDKFAVNTGVKDGVFKRP
ncbi:MAG TPA: pitrilysin family protein, partial [Bacteroidota bacterium]|nr:pitrilysin family protein [Bacteroidota bacterium]